MITVEFRERNEDGSGYTVAGALVVREDNTFEISGKLPLLEITLLDRAAPGGRLALTDDPARWARKCHQAFRSGYVTAVLLDDGSPSSS